MFTRTLLAFLLPASLLMAQGRPPEERLRGGGPQLERPMRARIMARLHEIRAQRIQKALGVPEAKANAIADRWGRFDQDSMDRRQGMRAARQQVQETLLGTGSEDEKNVMIRPHLDRFSTLHKLQQEAKARFETDIQDMLSPAQQGRFLLLMEEFQRAVLDSMPDRQRGNNRP